MQETNKDATLKIKKLYDTWVEDQKCKTCPYKVTVEWLSLHLSHSKTTSNTNIDLKMNG